MTSRVTRKFQIIIPKALRQQLKISPGTVLDWAADGETLRVMKLSKPKANGQSKVTTVAPWPKGALAKAYKRISRKWDRVETAAVTAQSVPSWED